MRAEDVEVRLENAERYLRGECGYADWNEESVELAERFVNAETYLRDECGYTRWGEDDADKAVAFAAACQ